VNELLSIVKLKIERKSRSKLTYKRWMWLFWKRS